MDSMGYKIRKYNNPLTCVLKDFGKIYLPIIKEDYDYTLPNITSEHSVKLNDLLLGLTGPPRVLLILRWPGQWLIPPLVSPVTQIRLDTTCLGQKQLSTHSTG